MSLKTINWVKAKERDIDIAIQSIYMVGHGHSHFKKMGVDFEVNNHVALGNGKLFFDAKELARAKEMVKTWDAKKIKEITDNFLKIAGSYELFLSKRRDIKALSSKEFCQLYLEFIQYNHDLVPYSFIVSMIVDEVVHQRIIQKLGHPDAEKMYLQMTQQPKLNLTTEEVRSRAHLAQLLNKDGFDKAVDEHIEKFGWLFVYRPTDPPLSREELIKSVKTMQRTPEINEQPPQITLETLDEETRALIEVMKENAWVRTYRRELMSKGFSFMHPMYVRIAEAMKLNFKDLGMVASWEIESFFETGASVSQAEIDQRSKCFTVTRLNGKCNIVSGELLQINLSPQSKKSREIKGQPAFPGQIQGIIQIVKNKTDIELFRTGNILVAHTIATWMTPVVAKCTGIITEKGGVLSHTAIVAREFQKPCVVGIGDAIESLENGMHVQLDATNGMVKPTKTKWIKRWAGSYTFISCSYWGQQYFNSLKQLYGRGLNKTLFIHKRGAVSFFIRESELKDFGNFLADIVRNDSNEAERLLKTLKDKTDKLLEVMDALEGKILTEQEYNQFLTEFDNYLGHYVFMKKTVDFLEPELLGKFLPLFKEARLYSEEVYSKSETFFRALARAIGEKENLDWNLLTCLKREELEYYLKNGALPETNTLEKRFNASALVFNVGQMSLCLGDNALSIESDIALQEENEELKGVVAYQGKVTGKCRIIWDPFAKNDFQEGDILVTGMTRPEFVPLMGKASAIVTDAGGMLCHAAITSREMKKPCIIGTEKATLFLKDGDLIEVDAFTGTVRKLN